MRDRLIKLLQSVPSDYEGNRGVGTIADYLIDNGVIVPPCKVGDTIYHVTKTCINNCPNRYKEDGSYNVCYGTHECEEWGIVELKFALVHIDFIDDGFYLTREEAEAAITERSKK